MNYLCQMSKVGVITLASTFMLTACNEQSENSNSIEPKKQVKEVVEKSVEAPKQESVQKAENALVTVNGVDIDKLTLQLHLKSNQLQGNNMNADQALDDLINIELLKQEAEQRGLSKRQDVKAEVERLRATVLATLLLRDVYANAKISDEEFAKEYEVQIAKLPKHEYHLQYLFLQDEAKAKRVLKSVKKNETNFDFLKKKYNKNSSEETSSGDTGWLTLNKLSSELAEETLKLKQGEISSLVKTKQGWYLIRLEGMRDASMPTLESMRHQLDTILRQKFTESFLKTLRAKTEINKVESTIQ